MSDVLLGQNRITLDVTDRAYVRQGAGPIQTCLTLEITRRLNGAGEWRATFPDNDPRTSLLQLKSRLARFYIDGEHAMTGIVEHVALALSESGERILTVSGRDMGGELAEVPLGFFEIGQTTPSTNAVQAVFVRAKAFDSVTDWTGYDEAGTTPVQTDSGVVASFAGESALSALATIADHNGESFRVWRDGSRKLTWLGADTPASGVRAVGYAGEPTAALANPTLTFIQSFGVERDGYELLTHVYPYGSGNGTARLNIIGKTRPDPSGYVTAIDGIRSVAASTAIGKYIGRAVEFKDIRPLSPTTADLINAKNQLYDAGLAYLKRAESSDVLTNYRLTVTHVPQALDVGTTIHVVYADDVYEIDADLVVLEIRSRYGAGTQESHELVVAPVVRKPVSDTSLLAGELSEGKVFRAHPQLNANAYTTSYRVFVGEDQTTGKGELRFWFGSEVMQVERVLLRFNLARLVSPASAIGSTASVDVDVTVSGTIDISHDHDMRVYNVGDFTPITLETVYYAKPQNVLFSNSGAGGGLTGTEKGGSSSLSLSGTGSGTVDLSGAITTSFGIFRAAQIDTYAISDLEYSLNGGAWTALSGATSLGGGWYQLDLSSSLVDSNFRPINETNILEFRRTTAAGTGKSAMLDCFIRVREVIAATALV